MDGVLLMEELLVIIGGCLVLVLSLLILRFRARLGELSSRYASPTLDAAAYASIWRGIGLLGLGIGGLWILVAAARLL